MWNLCLAMTSERVLCGKCTTWDTVGKLSETLLLLLLSEADARNCEHFCHNFNWNLARVKGSILTGTIWGQCWLVSLLNPCCKLVPTKVLKLWTLYRAFVWTEKLIVFKCSQISWVMHHLLLLTTANTRRQLQVLKFKSIILAHWLAIYKHMATTPNPPIHPMDSSPSPQLLVTVTCNVQMSIGQCYFYSLSMT